MSTVIEKERDGDEDEKITIVENYFSIILSYKLPGGTFFEGVGLWWIFILSLSVRIISMN